jgi:hypothetical protein
MGLLCVDLNVGASKSCEWEMEGFDGTIGITIYLDVRLH